MKRRLQNLTLVVISMCALLSPVVFSSSAFAESLPRPNAGSDPALLRKWLLKLDVTLAKDGPDADNYCSKAQLFEWLHEPEAAIQQYSLAIKHNPKDARFFNGRARALRDAKRWSEAVSDYSSAVSLGQRNSEVFVGRSLAELALRKYSSAYSDAIEAIKFNPRESLAWLAKGYAEFEMGRFNESIVSLSKAIELNPKKAAYYKKRSAAYGKLGDHKNAGRDMVMYERYSKAAKGE